MFIAASAKLTELLQSILYGFYKEYCRTLATLGKPGTEPVNRLL